MKFSGIQRPVLQLLAALLFLALTPQAIAADSDAVTTLQPIGRVKVGEPEKPAIEPASTEVDKRTAEKTAAPVQPADSPSAKSGVNGEAIVNTTCAACHIDGVLDAPKLGHDTDWQARIAKGVDVLHENAIKGFQAMPAKGGNPNLSDQEVVAAVDYMLDLVKGTAGAKPAPAPQTAAADKTPETATQLVPSTGRQVAVIKKEEPKITQKKPVKRPSRRANTFNRLMKPPSQRNPPPAKDGIHDPKNQGTHVLQPPKEAFAPLHKSKSGNRVDWVKSLENGAIEPRYDRYDPDKKPVVLDLNIVREVKGSMPDVVYPHKQHTEWLDCSNCHPKIFIPKKGANNISMASILLGEKCGVCHGKVAFPVSECRKCHSKNKPKTAKK
mgnify:CR=1 FL=1